MSRFKFRAWDKRNKKILTPVYLTVANMVVDEEDLMVGYLGIDCELMQFTGLKDKNGREIYEGDIYQNKNGGKDVVEWYERIQNCGCCSDINAFGYDFDDDDPDNITVIGNIYENPELLKKEQK